MKKVKLIDIEGNSYEWDNIKTVGRGQDIVILKGPTKEVQFSSEYVLLIEIEETSNEG